MDVITRLGLLAVVAGLMFGCAEEKKKSGPIIDPPGIGEFCGVDPNCTEGICSRDIFDRQCSAMCMTNPDCQILSLGTACVAGWCALPCTLSSDCPANTECVTVGDQMACKAL